MNAQPELDRPNVAALSRATAHFTGTPVKETLPGRLRRHIQERPGAWIAGFVAVVVAAIAIAWATTSTQPAVSPLAAAASAADSAPLVSVMTPAAGAVTSSVTFTGAIAARHDMPIGVEGEGGRITAVYVEAGDLVKRGQVMARLDQSVLLPQVNRLAASLEEARAQAALSLAEFGRAQGVEAAGALSREEIERRRAQAVTDEARVKVAAAQLAEAQARLRRTQIRAPSAGIVLTRKAEVGQTASVGGDPLFRLASEGAVEMQGQVAEQDLVRLRIGQPATVRLTGISEPFTGKVRLLGAVIDPETRLGEVRIELSPDPRLRPGAYARGRVVVGEANRPVLPQTAVLSDAQGTFVYVVNAENRVERRTVKVGDTSLAGVVIASGLEGAERVVSTAGGFLREGELVKVAPSKGAPAADATTSP